MPGSTVEEQLEMLSHSSRVTICVLTIEFCMFTVGFLQVLSFPPIPGLVNLNCSWVSMHLYTVPCDGVESHPECIYVSHSSIHQDPDQNKAIKCTIPQVMKQNHCFFLQYSVSNSPISSCLSKMIFLHCK